MALQSRRHFANDINTDSNWLTSLVHRNVLLLCHQVHNNCLVLFLCLCITYSYKCIVCLHPATQCIFSFILGVPLIEQIEHLAIKRIRIQTCCHKMVTTTAVNGLKLTSWDRSNFESSLSIPLGLTENGC